MYIYDKLTSDDREHIIDYIEAFAGFDGKSLSTSASLDHILRFWDRNKEDLFKVFGGEVLLSKTISFDKPLPELEEEVSEILVFGHDGREFYVNFDAWARQPEYASNRYDLLSLLYCETLAKNIYVGPNFTISTPDGHVIAINSGCKASKVLGKIANAFDLGGYEKFRIAHSMCLNQKQLKGELCLSIHPLDYMTMSDNNSGWSSCMNWMDGGDYRQGTVEMMNSPCVVVAYLRASADMETCCGWTWNNKKWRQLFIVTPYIITGIRQYPYNSDELNGITLQWLRELAEKNGGWGPYEDTAVKVHNRNTFPIASLNKLVHLDFYTRFMYNDFYSEHLSYVSADIPERYELCFSGESECMQCGDDISDYCESDMDASSLTCNDCEAVFCCAECGNRCDMSDMICVDGLRVCSYCYEEHYHECTMCEETHYEEYLSEIYLREKRDQSADELCYHISVCDNCSTSSKFAALFGEISNIQYGRWMTRPVVDLDNITIEGLDYFDVWRNEDYERFRAIIEARSKGEGKPSSNTEI